MDSGDDIQSDDEKKINGKNSRAWTRRTTLKTLGVSAGLSASSGKAKASPIAELNIDDGLGVRGTDGFYFRSGDRIKEYDRSSDSVTDMFAVPSRARPGSRNALAYGDGSLWFADATQDNFDGRIVELDPVTGDQRSEINLRVDITGLAFGDGSLWAADITGNDVIEFTPNGEKVNEFDVGGPANTAGPQGLAYSRNSVFLGENDNNSVHEFAPDGTYRGELLSGRSYESLAATDAELLGTNADGDLIQLLRLGDGSPGRVVGGVTDDIDNPLPGATVEIVTADSGEIEATTVARDDGEYSVEVPPGEYFARAMANGNTGRSIEFQIVSGGVESAFVVIDETRPGAITGDVINREKDPLSNATVKIVRPDLNEVAVTTTTDEDGNFVVAEIAPGEYYARAVTGENTGRSTSFQVRTSETESVNVVVGLGSTTEITQIETQDFPEIDTFELVRDDGGPVSGLGVDDFKISEEGVTQTIESVETIAESNTTVGTVLTIDKSGSMSDRLNEARTAAKTFVSNFAPDDQAAVIGFDTTVDVVQNPTSSQGAIDTAIDSLSAGGNTALFDAVIESVRQTETVTGRNSVIVLADGQNNEDPNGGNETVEDVIEAANDTGVPVNTIGLRTDAYNEENLRRMAEETGGIFFRAPSADELERIYLEISESISSEYRLQYVTENDRPDGTERTVETAVTAEGEERTATGSYVAPERDTGGAEVAIEATRTETIVRSPVTVQVTNPDSQEYEYCWMVADSPSDGEARLLHEDQVDAEASSKRYEVFLPLSDGRWELSVTVADESGTQIGTGSITVDVSPDRLTEYVGFKPNGFESANDLIEEYAPKFEFAAGEQYFPTRYEAYIENARVLDSTGSEVHDEPSPLDLTQGDYDPADEDNELFLKGDEGDFRTYQERYPQAVHARVTDTTFRGDTYLAVVYFAFYLFDPKKQTNIDGALGKFLSSHASDTEPVVLLFDRDGPKWVGTSQHYDGTYTRWEKVDKEENSVVVYPAQGAHANYLVDTKEYEFPIPYQGRFFPFPPSGTVTAFSKFQVDRGIGDVTGGGRVWSHPQDYELVTLTGDEPWGEFGGVFTSDPGVPRFETGRLPQQRDLEFNDPGQYVERDMTPETDVLDDGLVQGVIEILSSLSTENLPDLPVIVPRTTFDDLTGVPSEFVIENFRNPGKKPHEFAVEAELEPDGIVTPLTYEDTKRLEWRPSGPVSFDEIRVPIGEEFNIPDEGSLQLSVDVRTYPTDTGGPSAADWQQDDSVYRVSRTIDLGGLFDLSLTRDTFSTSDSVRTTAVQPVDEVDSTVTLTNNGDSTERVTVTLAARGPRGGLYNRNWEISEEVVLPPGNPREVTLSYPVTSELPKGTYDLETDVWLETGSETLTTELKHQTDTDAFEVTKPQATVTIETVPDDATVYIAGESGPAPFTTTLPEGTYAVDVVAEGADPVTRTVTITGGEDRTATVDLTSPTVPFSVDSTPDGTDVFLDGDPAGETPLTVQLDANDQYDVRLQKDGLESRTYESVSPWRPLTVTLKPVESALAAAFDDGNGEIEASEVLSMIEAYNDPADDRVQDARTVLTVIAEYNDDGRWEDIET